MVNHREADADATDGASSVGDYIMEMASVAPARIAESAFVVPSQPAAAAPSASDNDDVVEITLDLRDDSVVTVHSVQLAGGADSPVASSTASRAGSSCAGPRTDRSLLGFVHRLKGLNFVRGGAGADWAAVEGRFKYLQFEGHLFRRDFGRCVGIMESGEFALQLFDALAWRRGICRDYITKAELRHFWDQISNPSAEIRLQIILDM